MITENKVKAINLAERSRKDIISRSRKTQSIRDQVFESPEVSVEYFEAHGTDGVKQVLISVNSVADSNQLDYLQKILPEDAFNLLVAYNTLRASDPSPEDETLTIAEVMAESLRWAERLNKHPESTFSQEPRFQLIPSPSGVVTVGDEIIAEPEQPPQEDA